MSASALSFIPQEYHADILAGTSTIDVAPYLNNGLSNEKVLQLPLHGQMCIASTLLVPSKGGIIGANFGCTIRALPNFGDNPLIRNATQAPATAAERDRDILIIRVRIDGNKANNSTATEFGHGIALKAVNGARLDVEIVNPHGDGVSIQPSGPGVYEWFQHVGCSNVSGKVRTFGCQRQGVAIICGEQIDLDCYDEGTNLMAVDLEPDHPDNFIRNIFIRLLSKGTGNGSDISGGVCVAGDGLGCRPTNVAVDFEIYDSGGYGAIWRDAQGLSLRGTIHNPTHAGLVGIGAGTAGSRVFFHDVLVHSPGTQGMAARETVGSTYDGAVRIEGAGTTGLQIENARGGVLGVRVKGSGQQGFYLDNVQGMTFPSPTIESSHGDNVWLRNGSAANRFQFLKSTGSVNGWGVREDPGCNDNKAFFARVSGNGAGNVSLSGANSSVPSE